MKRVFQECVFFWCVRGRNKFQLVHRITCELSACLVSSPLSSFFLYMVYGANGFSQKQHADKRMKDFVQCHFSFGVETLPLGCCCAFSILLFSLFRDASKSHNLSNDMKLNRKILPSLLLLYFWSDEAKNFDFFTLFRFFFQSS